jgi:hypothetical protein
LPGGAKRPLPCEASKRALLRRAFRAGPPEPPFKRLSCLSMTSEVINISHMPLGDRKKLVLERRAPSSMAHSCRSPEGVSDLILHSFCLYTTHFFQRWPFVKSYVGPTPLTPLKLFGVSQSGKSRIPLLAQLPTEALRQITTGGPTPTVV